MSTTEVNRASLYGYMKRMQGVCTCEIGMRFCASWEEATALMEELVGAGEVRSAPLKPGQAHVANWKATGAGERRFRHNSVEPNFLSDHDVPQSGKKSRRPQPAK